VAPDFTANYLTAADANGRRDRKTVKLSEFRGQKNVVLAFFPAAFSPGCTTEMTKYRDNTGEFNSNNTVIPSGPTSRSPRSWERRSTF